MTVPHGGYADTWSVLSTLAAELSPAERQRLLGGTATAVYGLGTRRAQGSRPFPGSRDQNVSAR